MIKDGEQIGRYRVRSLLGAGGMGEVYLADDTELERRVALKLLPAEVAADEQRMKRFVQEAKTASALNHPNIVTVHDIGQTAEGKRFFATEFVDGITLRERLGRGGMKLGEALDVAVQVASALVAAHAAGIIHRDIKPENVMLRPDGLVKVLDFGLAKTTGLPSSSIDTEAPTQALVNTDPGSIMGTVGYMSPEQAKGSEIDVRTDIWSLGVVLYELVTGHLPFTGATPSHVIVTILEKEPAPLSAYAKNVPEALEWIITEALTKDREERTQTARELLKKLQRLKQRVDAESELERSVAPHISNAPLRTGEQQPKAVTQTTAIRTSEATADAAAVPTVSSAEYVVRQIKGNKKSAFFGLAIVILVFAGLGFAVYKLAGRAAGPPPPERKMKIARLVTGVNGRIGSVSVSPDGKYVAYALYSEQAASLWVRQVSQETSLQIVPPVEDSWFANTVFSPDGELVYFIGGNNKTNTLGSLYQVPVLGGRPPKKILDNVTDYLTLSPDGKQVAFLRYDLKTDESALMVANVDGSGGGEPRKISSRQSTGWFSGFSWSPDGRRIAAAQASVPGGVSFSLVEISVAPGVGEEKLLTEHKWHGNLVNLQWLRDDSGILMQASEKPTDPQQFWHLSFPNGELRRVTNDLNDYRHYGVTADASTIITNVNEWTSKIWVAAPNEEEPKAKKISSGRRDGGDGLAWAPDGRLVYTTLAGDNQDIWIMNADGTGAKPLTADAYPDDFPKVSPDGRYVVFQASRADNIPHIWRMDLDGGNQKQLSTAEDYLPSFSPDGRWVLFNSWRTGSATLWKVPVDGGEEVQVSGLQTTAPFLSPDGKLILCSYYDAAASPPRWRPALVSAENGGLVRVIEAPLTTGKFTWSLDGREFLYTDTRKDITNLWSQPAVGGGSAPKQLTKFTSDFIAGYDLARDGKSLAIARYTSSNEIVMIKDFR